MNNEHIKLIGPRGDAMELKNVKFSFCSLAPPDGSSGLKNSNW